MPRRASEDTDIAFGYNRVKEYKGQRYTGMAVGRTHHWRYDQGDWKEKKTAPDKWEITYSTVKRRVGHAPEGSGAPVGTAYHWFILAHQYVEKLNANDYMTQMIGLKYKLAHKRVDRKGWSASGDVRKKQLIGILKHLIEELEREPEQMTPIPLELDYKNTHYTGTAIPVLTACENGACYNLDITLNREHIGILRLSEGKWKISEMKSKGLANAIGAQIMDWYAKPA
jgi:hypothetical protein